MTYEEARNRLLNSEMPKDKTQRDYDAVCLTAIEKLIPKPVANRRPTWKLSGVWIYSGVCPDCGTWLGSETNPNGCPNCVRAIDWGKKE